jgi:thiol-disulfide isomerase/thioredoxin
MRMLSLVACCLPLLAGAEPAQKSADDAAEVTLKTVDYDGVMETVARHKGKIVVMDAWSTWCEPCVAEFPGLVELHKKYGPDKVACISLSFDVDGDPAEFEADVLAFLKEQGATFDNLLSSDPEALYDKFDFPAIPAVFVYDAEGNLAQRVDNSKRGSKPFTYADVDAVVQKLLAGEKP